MQTDDSRRSTRWSVSHQCEKRTHCSSLIAWTPPRDSRFRNSLRPQNEA